MRKHLVCDIKGLRRHLAEFKRADRRRLYCYDCFGVSDEQLFKELDDMEAKGYTVLPSDTCDNVLPDGRCGGHPDKPIS